MSPPTPVSVPPTSAAADDTRRSSLWQAAFRGGLRLGLGLAVVAAALLLAAWLILHWAILPHIDEWRVPIQTRASQALGVPVRLGSITMESRRWMPSIELRDVVLLNPQGEPALVLPRVRAALSPRSLLALDLRFSQLVIEGAHLDVRRDAAGRVSVAGLALQPAQGPQDDALTRWFFRQHEFVIRGGSVRWTDLQRGAPALALTDVQLRVRNGLRRHDLRLDATPPKDWGERFTLQGRFTQPLLAEPGDWRRWSGTLYAHLPDADVGQLRRHMALPFSLEQGQGAVRAWVEWSAGKPQAATVDVALHAVSARLAANVQALALRQIEGRFVAQRLAEGTHLALQQFGFTTADGVRWPRSDMALRWRQREGQAVTGGEFTAQRLDLGLMTQMAARIPLGEAAGRWVSQSQPQGVMSGLSLAWRGPLDAPAGYQVKGVVQGLSIAALPAAEPHRVGRPGLRRADIELAASETGGTARLRMAQGALELPGVFAEPLVPLDRLDAQLQWRIAPMDNAAPRITLQVKEASLANADARGSLRGVWTTGPGTGAGPGGRYPGHIEIDGTLDRAVAARTARYLPLGIPEATRRYLALAIQGGTLNQLTFHAKGDVAQVPFNKARGQEGEFRIAAQVDNGTLAYVPSRPADGEAPAWVSPWPAFTQMSGELIFDRATMAIRNARGQVHGVQLSQVQGDIANLSDATLSIRGVGHGPLAGMLRFVNGSPVGDWTRQALAQAQASGAAELSLSLAMPLRDVAAATVRGSVTLAGNDVRITPQTPLLAAAHGRVDFSQQGFSLAGGRARVLGGEATLSGGTQPDGRLRFDAQGTASAEGLRRATELGVVSRLADSLQGQTAYRLALGWVQGHPEISLFSNLVGLGSDLPAPLRKRPEAALPLRLSSGVAPESLKAGQSPRDTVRASLGSELQVQYERDLSGTEPRIVRGGVGLAEPVPVPVSGVAAHVYLPQLDLDRWLALGQRLLPDDGPAVLPDALPPGTASAGAAAHGLASYIPTVYALRVDALTAGEQRLDKLVAGITREEGGVWRAQVDAAQMNGAIEYRAARQGTRPGLVRARLSRLSLAGAAGEPGAPATPASGLDGLLADQPDSVPALDIVVDDLELRGRRMGRVEVEAVNRVRGEVREWRLSRLSVATPEARLSAVGSWTDVAGDAGESGAGRRAVFDFKLDVSDSGALLDRLGMGQTIRGGKGVLAGQVSWRGSPLSLHYPSLTGRMNLAVDAGQFLKAQPGAARLLSVLSMQSLPRRLALDFRDVFQEGFAFDNVTGDVTIAEGVASTNNLRMRGVQAAVLMEGSADLAKETHDLRVVVVPEINAGTASLAYAVINPALGLGTFLAQMVLRQPLIEAGTREFHVSGDWDDPKVERVERRPAAPSSVKPVPSASPASSPVPSNDSKR